MRVTAGWLLVCDARSRRKKPHLATRLVGDVAKARRRSRRAFEALFTLRYAGGPTTLQEKTNPAQTIPESSARGLAHARRTEPASRGVGCICASNATVAFGRLTTAHAWLMPVRGILRRHDSAIPGILD